MSESALRVLIDTNVFVSHLLSRRIRSGTVSDIIEAMSLDRFTLLMPDELLMEIEDVITSRPYFVERIDPETARTFLEALRTTSELLPALTALPPAIVRDHRDDYLLEQAKLGNADYLVSGDRDLLALADSISNPRIVSPAEFMTLLG